MNDISILNQNGNLLVSSREVAKNFEKEHKHVIRDIENYIKTLKNGESPNLDHLFIENEYTTENANGVMYKEYLMTRDGFSLLAMGFTGKKALEWKLKYIKAFNNMEKAIAKQQKQISNLTKKQEMEARLNNSKARQANVLLKIADKINIPEYKQILNSYAAEIITGQKLLPLQAVEKKTYSAEEIGNQIGISSNMVGRIANLYKLKTPEYGKLFYDKAKHSNKQVETFRYYDSIIPIIKGLIRNDKNA
jgi:Rha family phage regulatory protein